VQWLDYTQGLNRYTYCMNNPLCYVDEDGELWFIIGGALIGAYLGASMRSKSFNPKHWTKDWWKGALIGGATGAATGGLVGTMWGAGATISLGVSGSSFYVPLVTFTPGTALAGGVTTVTIGGGLGLWSGITMPLGKNNGEGGNAVNSSNTYTPDPEVSNAIERWNKDRDNGAFNAMDVLGFSFSQASSTVYNEKANRWMGKNGKTYSFKFNGNQYTGGRVNFARNLATKLDYAAKGTGAINIGMSLYDGYKGKLSPVQTAMDVAFGGYSTFAKDWTGPWVGIWYNLGKEYGPIHKYLEYRNKQKY
jgi:hypothetical protein